MLIMEKPINSLSGLFHKFYYVYEANLRIIFE
jgi:hypothetical protein